MRCGCGRRRTKAKETKQKQKQADLPTLVGCPSDDLVVVFCLASTPVAMINATQRSCVAKTSERAMEDCTNRSAGAQLPIFCVVRSE